ncbi:MAG TPA: LptA/OstA family protein, partial [Alphaproteobacteria bacterium]
MPLIQRPRVLIGVLMVSASFIAAAPGYAADDAVSEDNFFFQIAQAQNIEPAPLYTEDSKEHEPPAIMPGAPPQKPSFTPIEPNEAAREAEAAGRTPVDYAADAVDYNQDSKIVNLTGHVELVQEGRTLIADRVVYNLKDDIATAEGNVVIKEPTGDVSYAESVELSDKMRNGLVNRLFTTMADGSRIWAATGTKQGDTSMALQDARYTACKACEKDPDKRPPWQLHADSVDWRKEEQRVVYKNAWLDLGGVPVLYTPYFSHPDGTVEQKSGFLTPTMGWNSELGGFYSQPYYWAISPSTDMTVTVMPTTDQGPLLRN